MFIPSISDIPTTSTPLVYNFIPAIFPTGITFVFGNTSTLTFFKNIFSNKLNFTTFFPAVFIVFVCVLDNVSIIWSFSVSFAFSPNIVFKFIDSPSNIIILSGIDCIESV